MKIIYKIFNPMDGSYIDTYNVEECKTAFAELAYAFFLQYAHNQPVSIVIEDNGVETWRNCQGDEIVNPLLVQEKLMNYMEILN